MPSVLVFVIGVDRWMSPNYHPSNCLPGRDRQGAILEEWSERSESFMRSGWRLKGLERTDVSGLQTDLKRLRRSSAVGEAWRGWSAAAGCWSARRGAPWGVARRGGWSVAWLSVV
jgi:hypothetical protein